MAGKRLKPGRSMRQEQAEEAIMKLIDEQQKKRVELTNRLPDIGVENIKFVRQAAAVLLLNKEHNWSTLIDVFGVYCVQDALALKKYNYSDETVKHLANGLNVPQGSSKLASLADESISVRVSGQHCSDASACVVVDEEILASYSTML